MLKFFHRKIWWGRKKCLTLHSQTRNKHRLQRELKKNGAVVQPVRIQACHAWGRGFESRPHRRGERKSSIVSIYTSCCSFSFVQAIHTDIPALPVQCARRTNLLPTPREPRRERRHPRPLPKERRRRHALQSKNVFSKPSYPNEDTDHKRTEPEPPWPPTA